MTPTADIVIIGGGVHGCSLAFHLAAASAGSVVLIEKKHIAAGPTAQSGAMIRALYNEKIHTDLVIASTRMFEQWNEVVGGDAGFVQQGFLRITDTLDAEAIGGDLELTRQAGEPFEILTGEQLASLVPAGEFTRGEFGILFPTGGYADPYKATVELADAARRHGAHIYEGVEVTGIRVARGRVSAIELDAGTIATPLVVNCAGSWSDRVAAMAGIQLPIKIQPAPTCLFRRPESMAANRPILSDGVNKVYLRAMGDAVYRAAHFGHSDHTVEPDDFDEAVPAHQVQMLRDGLYDRYDDMRRAPSLGGFMALYDMTPDSHPIVGPIEGVNGFWCDCGWSGGGFAPAPASGRSLARMIMGDEPEVDLSYFRWPRSAEVGSRLRQDWVHR
jgi:sarcosine oxidase subunit beta